MIGKALFTLLTTDTAITAMVGTRIRPARFGQADALPCLFYATDNLTPISCRSGMGVYTGTVEVSMMARTGSDIITLTELIRARLDRFSGVAEGYSLSFDEATSGPDDAEDDTFYLRLDYPVTACKLS